MADKTISALTGASTPLAGTEVLPIVQSGTTVKVSAANITAGRAVSVASLSAVGSGAGGTQTLATLNAAADAFSNSVELALEPLISGQSRTGIGAQREGVGSGAAVYLKAGGNEVLRGTVAGNISVATGNVVMATAGKGIDFSANTHAAGMTSELLNWYEEGVWTPVVRGAATAGTYELNTGVTKATYTRIGRVVHLSAYIVLAGAITGGGTGELTIFGVPFAKGANIPAFGVTSFSGVDFAAGANLSCYFGTTASSSQLFIWETNDNAGVSLTPISGVSAGDTINISITYEV
jgi:hypothetical protein